MAGQQLQQIWHAVAEVRHEAACKLREFQQKIEGYKTRILQLVTTIATHENQEKIHKLAKIEAFDLWVQKSSDTDIEDHLSAQTLLHMITTKLQYTLKTLKMKLYQATSKNDELQAKVEQHEKQITDHHALESLLGFENIEDPGNTITIVMQNLPPPISIFQYYQTFKPMLLRWSGIFDITNKSHISKEQFQALWHKANSAARDLLVFMWALKDLTIPKGIVEVTTANPPFYLTRFCIAALTHMSKHHEEFYTNIDNMNSLPHLDPYEPEDINEIQEMANAQFPKFLAELDVLAGEETTLFHEASQHHHNLS